MLTLPTGVALGIGLAWACVFFVICVKDIRLGVEAYLLTGWLPLDIAPLQGSRISAGLRPVELLATILFCVWFAKYRNRSRPLLRLRFEYALAWILPAALVSTLVGFALPDPAVDQRHLKLVVSAGQILLFAWPLGVYLVAADVVRSPERAQRLFRLVYWCAPLAYLVILVPRPYNSMFGWSQYFALFASPFALTRVFSPGSLARRLVAVAIWLCPLFLGLWVGRAFFYGAWLVASVTVAGLRLGSRVLLLGPLAAGLLVIYLATQAPGSLPGPLQALVKSEEEQQSLGGRSGRVAIWTDAVGIWSEHPVFGVGPGNSWPYMHRYSVIDTPHSQYLNILLELGVPGFAAFLTFVGSALTFLLRAWRNAPRGPWRDVLLGCVGMFAGLAAGSVLGDFMLHSIRNGGLETFSFYYPQWLLLGAAVGGERHAG
jgi:hypothetical protein